MKKFSSVFGIIAVILIFSLFAIGSGSDKASVSSDSASGSKPETQKATEQINPDDATYTVDEINADRHLYFLGKTRPEYVVAKFNDDFSAVTIMKNGEESDGLMGELVDVSNVGTEAFYNHNELTSVSIKSGVKSIGDRAFADCDNLTSVTIPDSVTSIGSGAFAQCVSLTSITIPASEVEMGDSVFDGCTSLETVTLPNQIYANVSNGSVISTKVYKIRGYMFKDCASLKNITFCAYFACEVL